MSSTATELPTFEVAEWEHRDLPGLWLSPEDTRLKDSLGGDGPNARLAITELRSGLRVTARSWVGVVRFSSFEVRVVPKLAGGDVGLVRLIDYASGLDSLGRHPAIRTFKDGGGNLLDLVALLLAEACERVARAGLRADYREIEDDLPVVRGRLLGDRQVLRRFGRIDRVECRYDEHTTDTPDNQVLLAALSACAPRVRHPAVSLRVRRLVSVFGEACSLDELDLRLVRSATTYDRLNEHYRDGHALAWLVLDGLGIDDLFGRGSARCFAFLIDMNRLFEDFITRWLTQLLAGYGHRVVAQRQDRTVVWDAALGKPYSHVRPDLLIEAKSRPGRFLPVDAKYKLYDEQGIAPADIYQSFLYAFAYSQSTRPPMPASLLMYPASTETSERIHLHVRRSRGPTEAELLAVGVPVAATLAEAVDGVVGEVGSAALASIVSRLSVPEPSVTET